MRVNLGGKRWEVLSQKGLPHGHLGRCSYDEKQLKLPMEGETKGDLEIIVHEGLHAACPWMDEEAVESAGKELSNLVWRLGWRKED